MKPLLIYYSEANKWHRFFSEIQWTISDKGLLRLNEKSEEQLILYKSVDDIRLHYRLGGKNAPPKYCCTFCGNGLKETISLSKKDEQTEKATTYIRFVNQFIKSVQEINSQLQLRTGFTPLVWRLNCLVLLGICSVGIFIAIFSSNQAKLLEINGNIFGISICLLMILASLPRAFYLINSRPNKIDYGKSYPQNVFPKNHIKE